jgi:hypothetical protein
VRSTAICFTQLVGFIEENQMANRNWASGGKIYSMHVMPVLLDANCTIDSTATGKTKNLKGPGVSSITRIATGTYKVVLQDNYNKVYSVLGSIISPSTGSVAVTAAVSGTVYVIKTLGNTTTAQFVAMGLPAGITPAVGVTFAATGAGVGTATLSTPAASGVDAVELAGDPNTTIASIPQGSAYIIVRTLLNNAAADPVDGSTLELAIYLSNSSVIIAGE